MLSAREVADLGAALDSANDAYGKNPAGGHIWHVSLSLAASERLMADQEWSEIAQVVMNTMGFEEDGMVSAAWVAIGHGVSAQGNQHIHIAGSIVRNDGSAVKIWQDRMTLSRSCHEIKLTYGLNVVGVELLSPSDLVLGHPVGQRPGVDPETPGHLGHRLVGLPDDPHGAGAIRSGVGPRARIFVKQFILEQSK